ncbi:shikimate kinase [bacterium]|nr:MAG: shikimate kinase [bacterium]
MNIYLVGFMATGKTTLGREIARKKKWSFLDLDELITLREKRSIADIFAKYGEDYFRRIEKRVLKEVAKEDKFVVACGGGIVMDKKNIEVMQESGEVVCLAASIEEILKRTRGHSYRPLLNVKDPGKQIELLLKLRQPFYAQIKKSVDTSKYTIKQATERILKITSKTR